MSTSSTEIAAADSPDLSGASFGKPKRGDHVYILVTLSGVEPSWVLMEVEYLVRADPGSDETIVAYPVCLSNIQRDSESLSFCTVGEEQKERPTDGRPVVEDIDAYVELRLEEVCAKNQRILGLSDRVEKKIWEVLHEFKHGPLSTREKCLQSFEAPCAENQECLIDEFCVQDATYFLQCTDGWVRATFQSCDGHVLYFDVPALGTCEEISFEKGRNGIRFDLPPGFHSIDTAHQLAALKDLKAQTYLSLSVVKIREAVEQELIATALGLLPLNSSKAETEA